MARAGRRFVFPVAIVLAVAVVALPAVAGSETPPTITAVNHPGGGIYSTESHEWSPASATVAADGTVTFANGSSTVEHGVVWAGGPQTPSCTGVSVDAGKTDWQGSCTFSTPGIYTFYCYVHPSEMKGTITVSENGTVTASPSGPTATTPSSGGAPPSTGAPAPPPLAPSNPTPPASPLAGSAQAAVRLAAIQHGGSVHGFLDVSAAGSGGRLEVRLLARRGSLAGGRGSAGLQVGSLVRAPLEAGRSSFAVRLDGRAEHALRARGRVSLGVRIVLRPVEGPAVGIDRSVLMR